MTHDSISFIKIKNPIFEIQQRGKFLHKNNTVVPDSGKKKKTHAQSSRYTTNQNPVELTWVATNGKKDI